jgi:diguanylate cyclase (GGDEF)-like protein
LDQSAKKLRDLLAEFARTLTGDFHVQETLDQLVLRVVDVLPVTGAGVMVMGPADELHFAAASNETVTEIEALQNELDEGPCLEAYRHGEPVAVPDLSMDERFPRFSPRAYEAGLVAVFTFPIRLDNARFGALDLYRDQPGGLSAEDMESAQVLADVAAAYIHNARAREEAASNLDVLRQRSLHDPLTGLPNRALLKERIEQAVARASRSHHVVAVLFVDLDRFKAVNDQFGHEVGDRMLITVAGRLRRILRAGDTLARQAGDEFVILCEDLQTAESAERVAERVASAFASPFELDGNSFRITASVGLAFCGPGQEMPESLLRDADMAMYQSKQAGGAQHRISDPAARLETVDRRRLGAQLRDALGRGEFRLAYQPVVEVGEGGLVGIEALLRWEHPERGWVMPNEILPVAESTGLIADLGEWVLRQACRDLQHWRTQYGTLIPHITVNVSPNQVTAPGFDSLVSGVLKSEGADPNSISLEVTESAFLEDGPRTLAVLEQVKDLGVGLILDDFGTGYSSLNYLRLFPFDVVKIDRVFIAGLGASSSTRKIVSAVVDLAHGLDLAVVAEGVETAQQLSEVTELGTDRVQGYYLCHPLLREQIDQRILEPAGSSPIRFPSADTGDGPHVGMPAPRQSSSAGAA